MIDSKIISAFLFVVLVFVLVYYKSTPANVNVVLDESKPGVEDVVEKFYSSDNPSEEEIKMKVCMVSYFLSIITINANHNFLKYVNFKTPGGQAVKEFMDKIKNRNTRSGGIRKMTYDLINTGILKESAREPARKLLPAMETFDMINATDVNEKMPPCIVATFLAIISFSSKHNFLAHVNIESPVGDSIAKNTQSMMEAVVKIGGVRSVVAGLVQSKTLDAKAQTAADRYFE